MDTIADRIPRFAPPDELDERVVDMCETCRHHVCVRHRHRERRVPPRDVEYVIELCVAEHDHDGVEWVDELRAPVEECGGWEMVDE